MIIKLARLSLAFRLLIAVSALFAVITIAPGKIEAANKIPGKNAVAGGFGFQIGLFDWCPGGFKWTNEYLRKLSDRVWLNLQFNWTTGDFNDRHCWRDHRGDWHCGGRWDGMALEMVVGPNLRFEMKDIPLVIDAKMAGAFETLFFGRDYAGVAVAFRGGVGVHYFLFENFGVGPEFQFTLGPGFIQDHGAEMFGTFDVQVIGCEYRF